MTTLIARWYAAGLWTAAQVNAAAARGWITEADAGAILGD